MDEPKTAIDIAKELFGGDDGFVDLLRNSISQVPEMGFVFVASDIRLYRLVDAVVKETITYPIFLWGGDRDRDSEAHFDLAILDTDYEGDVYADRSIICLPPKYGDGSE